MNKKKIVYISDFFIEHILGGGELNDDELTKLLAKDGFKVKKLQSHVVSNDLLEHCSDSFFIISNFVNLSPACKKYICNNLQYIIYEHDHKYVSNRNPALYKDFKVPNSDIVNYFFYKGAQAILCQSSFHKTILQNNLDLDNVVNLSGNLWSLGTLENIRKFSKSDKSDVCSIMESNIEHKNTIGAIRYAKAKNLKYELIKSPNYSAFLNKLSKNERFVFLPKTPETLSRVLVEARMLGCKVITNNLTGASQEDWFSLKGEEMVDHMIEKRGQILELVVNMCNKKHKKKTKPLVSIITTFHKGEEYLEHFMSNITSQTFFDNCELVIVDAKSPGNEKKIIDGYLEKFDNIVYHRIEQKLKPTPCINEAIKLSSGECLTFAFIDDVKKPDCIQKLYKHLKSNSDISLVYGDVVETSVPNQSFKECEDKSKIFEHSSFDFSPENMVKCLPGPMPLWYRDVHNHCGFFDDAECNYADDWDMWLRMVSCGYKFKKLDEKIGLYLVGGRSQENDNIEQRKEEAKIFFKYSNVFGSNFHNYSSYFGQLLRT